MDLFVTDPYGNLINYQNTSSSSGGRLDVDANGWCNNLTTAPVENIYWDYGTAPSGHYVVEVWYWFECNEEAGPMDYTVILTVDGVTTTYTGTLTIQTGEIVVEFDR
jgi:uncharacterized protein YfaP (DUF2135 family)